MMHIILEQVASKSSTGKECEEAQALEGDLTQCGWAAKNKVVSPHPAVSLRHEM